MLVVRVLAAAIPSEDYWRFFGFIQPEYGGDRVYYNIVAVVGGVNLSWGDRVSYFLGAAPDYRPRACEVTLLGTRG